jgi:hypothetical protein
MYKIKGDCVESVVLPPLNCKHDEAQEVLPSVVASGRGRATWYRYFVMTRKIFLNHFKVCVRIVFQLFCCCRNKIQPLRDACPAFSLSMMIFNLGCQQLVSKVVIRYHYFSLL